MNQPVPVPTNLSRPAQQMLSEVTLLHGEVVHYSIQGDGFFLGANPIAKAIASLQSLIVKLTGGHIRIFVMITNMRVLLLQSMQTCCGCGKIRSINAFPLASLVAAGSGKETQMCCIHARTVTLTSNTQNFSLVIKHLDDGALRDFVATLSQVMVANAHARPG